MNSGRAGRQGEPLWPADPRFHPAGGGGRRYDPSHDTRPEQRPEQRDAYRADYAPSADSRLSYEQGDPDWRGSPYSGGTPHHGGQDRRSTPQQPGSGEQHRAAPRHTGHAGEDGTGGAYAYRPASGGRGAAPAARGGEGRELSNPPESAGEAGAVFFEGQGRVHGWILFDPGLDLSICQDLAHTAWRKRQASGPVCLPQRRADTRQRFCRTWTVFPGRVAVGPLFPQFDCKLEGFAP